MKQHKNIIILLAIFFTLAGVYFWLTSTSSPGEGGKLYRFFGNERLVEISVTNQFGGFKFVHEDDKWVIIEPGRFRANQQKVNVMEDLILNLPINRTLEEELDQYGFSEPMATISLVNSNNEQQTFYIGNLTPSQSQVYLKDKESGKIFVSDIGVVSLFGGSLTAYRDTEIFSVDMNNISQLTYYNDQGKFISLKRYGPQNWQITYPYEAPARYIELDELIAAMREWKAVNYPYTNALDFSTMGLENPADILEFTDTSGNTQRLEFGNIEDGLIYLRVGDLQDIVQIFSVDIDFEQLTPDHLLFYLPLRTTIDTVAKITIESPQQQVTYEIDHSTSPPRISSNEAEIIYDDFVSLFVKYISLSADGYDPSSKAQEVKYIFTTTFTNGSTKTIRLLQRDSTSYFFDDGSGILQFYVNEEQIEQLIYRLVITLHHQYVWDTI